MTTRFNPDDLYSVQSKKIGHASMSTITALQNYGPATQLVAAAVVFELLLNKYGAHAGNVLEVARRIRDRESPRTPELRAVAMYMENQL